jgi:hypothetical protein
VRREDLLRETITISMTIGIETMGMTGARGTNLAMKTYNPRHERQCMHGFMTLVPTGARLAQQARR